MSDIVYLLKNGPNEELRYSLRSVEKNFPHGRIIFVGGRPQDITPDIYIEVEQDSPTKWANTRRNLMMAAQDTRVSEDFWLFNDDFFIMADYDKTQAEFDGELMHHIEEVEMRHGMLQSRYTKLLRHLHKTLTDAGIENPKNYAVHRPMLVNKAKALRTLQDFPDEPMFRALYGNINRIGGHQIKDCKFTPWLKPNTRGATVISTEDASFRTGNIGKKIREAFPEPSKWERNNG